MKASFEATLAGTNTSARPFSIGNEGDTKLVLEVPSNQLHGVLKLLTAGGKVLTIEISWEDD